MTTARLASDAMPIDRVIEAIEKERERRGHTKKGMAGVLGVSDQVYSNWIRRGLPRDYATRARIAERLGWDIQAVSSENHVISHTGVSEHSGDHNVRPGPDLKGDVPLISWIQAGAWHEAEDPYPPGDAEDYLLCPSSHGPRAYALRVEGDSMTASYGPSFPDGMIIFVDPDQVVENRQFAIARVEGENLVTFKQYVRDGDRHYLKPLNPQYETISRPFRLLGKVIGAYIQT